VISSRTRIFEATVEEIAPSLLPPVDILSASLPCVGFSKSGIAKKHLEFPEEDSSGTAFLGLLGIIRATNPSIVIHENVPSFAESVTCHLMTRWLELLGYQVRSKTLGKDLGAFERRDRHILLAVSQGLARHVDLDRIEPSATAPGRLAEILERIPLDSPRWKRFEYLDAKQESDIAQGKGFRRQVLNADANSCGTIGRGYHKSRSTEPFVAHPMNPMLSRLLTPTEHAAVKGIPVSAVGGLSDKTAHEILGQSVLFPGFRSLGRLIGNALDTLGQPAAPDRACSLAPRTWTPSLF
jgi:DNA (cytosine-5)-methyltransferase 1